MGKPLFTPQGSTSNKQGRVIANHIAGKIESFPGVLGTVICKAFDFTIGRAGLSERWARDLKLDVETVLWTGPDRPHYMQGAAPLTIKLVVERKNRRLVGVQVVGPGDGCEEARCSGHRHESRSHPGPDRPPRPRLCAPVCAADRSPAHRGPCPAEQARRHRAGDFAARGEDEDREGGGHPSGRAEPPGVPGDGASLRRRPHPPGRAQRQV